MKQSLSFFLAGIFCIFVSACASSAGVSTPKTPQALQPTAVFTAPFQSRAFPTDWKLNLAEALLLIRGRMSSRFRGAGTLTSVGASLASIPPFLQGGNPYAWLFYLLPGLVMDFAFQYPRYANQIWFLVLLGGLAHLTKPIGQLIVNLITGWGFVSFRFEILYPFAGHILFGMIGGLLGASIVWDIRRYSQKSSQ